MIKRKRKEEKNVNDSYGSKFKISICRGDDAHPDQTHKPHSL